MSRNYTFPSFHYVVPFLLCYRIFKGNHYWIHTLRTPFMSYNFQGSCIMILIKEYLSFYRTSKLYYVYQSLFGFYNDEFTTDLNLWTVKKTRTAFVDKGFIYLYQPHFMISNVKDCMNERNLKLGPYFSCWCIKYNTMYL